MVDDELIDIFIQESREHLEALEPELLEMENASSDSESINTIFRGVHSIKGSSGFFGFDQIMKLSHVMENVMALVREGELTPNREMIDIFLESTDKLKIMVESPQTSTEIPIEDEVKRLEVFLGGTSTENAASAPAADNQAEVDDSGALPEALSGFKLDPYILKDAIGHGHLVFVIDLYMIRDIKEKNRTPYDYFKEIESLGEFVDAYFDFSVITGLEDALEAELKCRFLFTTVMGSPDMITSVFDIPEDQVHEIDLEALKGWIKSDPGTHMPASRTEEVFLEVVDEEIEEEPAPQAEPEVEVEAAAPQKEEASAEPATAKTSLARQKSKKADETVRVPVSLLNDLMNLAGEMVLSRNQLVRVAEKYGQDVNGLEGIIQNMNLITSDMHERVMQTRLQPLAIILSKFHRIIRDLSNKLGKEIVLEIEGEDVELDKSIIEALSDPLTHLIRNTADHGIETPDEREAAGKTREGHARLVARHVGGQVVIDIMDDGRGLNTEKLKKKAIEKGLITPESAETMSDKQAFGIIFLPGFSTAEQVSDVSGRGVGMDVVRTNIEKLGGFIDIESELGVGTKISLKLPLTLAIIPAMIVGAGERKFAVPQVNLEEVVRLGGKNQSELVRGTRVLRLRESLLTLIDLREVLDLEEDAAADSEAEDKEEDGYVLVMNLDNQQYGLVVNELYDSEEIAVKPLSVYLKQAVCYSGVTIMGDGKVAMIIDIAGITEIANLSFEDMNAQSMDETDEALSTQNEDMESLLLFKNEGFELFAINLSTVARIEKVKMSDIELVGEKEYLNLGGKSIELVRMHDHMPVATPENSPEQLYVLIPKLVDRPIGIVATQIVDTVETVVDLDRDTIRGTGILGSTFISDSLVIVVDIYSLFESVDPRSYKVTETLEHFKTLNLLLVENNAFFRNIQMAFLQDIFAEVDFARNGLDAWEKLNDKDYHMVITELELPSLNGFELLARARKSERLSAIPFIATAGRNEQMNAQKSEEAGFNQFLMKFSKRSTQNAIKEVFEKNTPLLTNTHL